MKGGRPPRYPRNVRIDRAEAKVFITFPEPKSLADTRPTFVEFYLPDGSDYLERWLTNLGIPKWKAARMRTDILTRWNPTRFL